MTIETIYNIVPMSRTRLKKLTEELTRHLVARDEYPQPSPSTEEKVAELEKELPRGVVLDCRRAARERIENRKMLRCMTIAVQKEEDSKSLHEEDSVL